MAAVRMTLRCALRRDASRSVLIVRATVYRRADGGKCPIRRKTHWKFSDIAATPPPRGWRRPWACARFDMRLGERGTRRAKRHNSLDRRRTELSSSVGYARGRRRAKPPVAFSFPLHHGDRRRPLPSLPLRSRRLRRRLTGDTCPPPPSDRGASDWEQGAAGDTPGPTPAASPPAPARPGECRGGG